MKRSVKWVIIILLLLAISSAGGYLFMRGKFQAPTNQLTIANSVGESSFVWVPSDFGGVVEDHSAIMLPVKIHGFDNKFYMQFDLGMPSTVFNRQAIEAIQATLESIKMIEENNKTFVLDINLTLGNMEINLGKSRLYSTSKSKTVDLNNKDNILRIGTIGADIMDGRVLTIDYPNQKISLSDEVASDIKEKPSASFTYTERRVILEAVFEGG